MKHHCARNVGSVSQTTFRAMYKMAARSGLGTRLARVGNDTGIWGEVLGNHGENMCNKNGRRLLQFSSEHNLLISNTLFPHKRNHKYTWECCGKGLRSLIDYFLVGKEARKQVVNTKVVQGAEIGSDHYLVLLKIKLKAKRRTGGEGHA